MAYANAHRPWQLYQTVFEQTLYLLSFAAVTEGKTSCFAATIR